MVSKIDFITIGIGNLACIDIDCLDITADIARLGTAGTEGPSIINIAHIATISHSMAVGFADIVIVIDNTFLY